MKKYLVVSKGLPQAKAFEREAREYTAKNNLSVEWFFNKEVDYLDVVKTENIDVVIISPEVLITENKIKAELDTINVDYLSVKPSDFGLRRLDKIMPLLEGR
ncbi:MAG: hypothetical protein ACRCWG_03725 [Sarcina sp.]